MTYQRAMKLAGDASISAEAAGSAARGGYQKMMAAAVGQLADAVAELAKSDRMQVSDRAQAAER
jgi:hypothetical protein